jgi:hypothetical protein
MRAPSLLAPQCTKFQSRWIKGKFWPKPWCLFFKVIALKRWQQECLRKSTSFFLLLWQRFSGLRQFLAQPSKPGLNHTLDVHRFIEHGGGPDPQTLIAIKRFVQSQRLKRLAVPHSAKHLVKQIFVVTVVARSGDDQWR